MMGVTMLLGIVSSKSYICCFSPYHIVCQLPGIACTVCVIEQHVTIMISAHMQEWNDELAGVAQAYSKKCPTELNPDRASQAPSFSTVGENYGEVEPPSSASVGQVVGSWLQARFLYNYTTGQCSFRDQLCDLYTQVGTW